MRLVCLALSLLVLSCQTPAAGTNPIVLEATPAAGTNPTVLDAAPVAPLAADPPVAAGRISVWGEVPKQCT